MPKPLQVTPSNAIKRNKKKAKKKRKDRSRPIAHFQLHPAKVKALTAVLAGGSVKDAAAEAGVTERSVRYWIEQYYTHALTGNPEIWNTWGYILELAVKAVITALKGGNVDVAMQVLKTTPFMAPGKREINVDASKNLTLTDNSVKMIDRADITITPKEDEQFAAGVITELERMARLSQVPAIPQGDS